MILSGNKDENAIFKEKCIFSPHYRRGKYAISERPGSGGKQYIKDDRTCLTTFPNT